MAEERGGRRVEWLCAPAVLLRAVQDKVERGAEPCGRAWNVRGKQKRALAGSR